MLRQSDSKVLKKYSQMKLQMKREALAKLDGLANEKDAGWVDRRGPQAGFCYGFCYGFAENRRSAAGAKE
jgi:hypothetical protein